ncbi:hypothetical protein KAR91_06515 [Candidatus Pacearchaeota archaeon]|nr:hypothetical protein [Candidatus Pacearchaeota archaeon]
MPSSKTVELRKVKGVVGNKEDLPSQNPRVSLASRLRALQLRDQGAPGLMHLYGVFEQNKTLTFDSGENQSRAVVSDGAYLFVGLDTNPGKIIKVDLSDFTNQATLKLNVGESFIYSLVLDNEYLYAGLQSSELVKIKLDSFTRDSVISTSGVVNSLSSDGTSLYACTSQSPAKIDKIDINTFTLSSTLTLNAGENIILSSCVDDSYLYVGTLTAPGIIVKIKLDSFTRDSALTLDVGENNSWSLFTIGSYLYVGLVISPGKVIKIDLETFTKIGFLTLSVNSIYSIISDGTYLYTGSLASPSKISKVSLATFTEVAVIVFDVGDNNNYSIFTDGTYIYSGLYVIPGRVNRQYILPTTNLYERKIDLIYEQLHTGIHHVYPTLAAAVTITSSAVAWTMGNYTEIVPVDTIKTQFFLTGIILNNLVADSEYEVDIATGLAAAEVVIATATHETHDANLSIVIPISPPIKISSNTRLSARAATENAAGDTCTVKLMYKV